ncbi:FtsX-like permease family protein [Micromonospora sp. HM5-17]|jgi:putative ABC transport system permease protein|uniref:FtsX-like permease family protein n=1 Tax=Micromonospora sp. HM5-17 TaxID=2487710 RepID=UPI000F49619E|nr:FtsX-like permease family protein [Micromonospora sp. HM5-17]ROT28153.1 ABC transporter permease [Micromonospora sp. HM5-17]
MRAPVLRTQVVAAVRRPSRLLLTGLAIMVAAFVVYATVLTRQITERTAYDNVTTIPASADLVVGGGDQPPTNAATLARIRAVPGVAEAAGRGSTSLRIGDLYLEVRRDPGSGPLATTRLLQGSYPDAPGEVAITRRTAERMGLIVGASTTAVVATDAPAPASVLLTVSGLVEAGTDAGQDAYAPEAVVAALGGPDRVERIDLRLAPGADTDQVRRRIEPILAATAPERPSLSLGVEARDREAREAIDQLDSLFALVAMFVAIAVVAAALVATSTFRIVFAQRMRQLALLRLIGAGRGALLRALAAEGALTGLVAGVVGVTAALAVGHGVPPVLRSAGLEVSSPGTPLGIAVAVVLGAVLVTVLAVLAPAFSAARVVPLEALRVAGTTPGRRGIATPRLVSGLGLLAGAALLAYVVITRLPEPEQQQYRMGQVLLLLVGSGALAFFALVALGPVLVRPVLAVVGWPVRRFGPIGRLAVGGIGGAPRRAAAVSVVVALGVTLITGVLVGGDSVRVVSDRELALRAPADLELSAEDGKTLPPGLVERVRSHSALTRVTPYRRLAGLTLARGGPDAVRLDDEASALLTTDLDLRALPTTRHLDVADGSLADLGPGRVVLAEQTARDTGLRVGDTVALRYGERETEVRVAAILPDAAPLATRLVADRGDLDRLGVPSGYSGLLADAARPGEQGRTAAVRALRQALDGTAGVGLAVHADERDEANRLLDALIGIAIGLVGLTVIIAVVGVGTTTALSVVERVRESGLLRAIGLSRSGLGLMLTTEAALYGLIGATLGLVLGIPYAWLAVKALRLAAPLTLPVLPLLGVFAALIALTALAGVLPARRAARVTPVAALGTDG